MYNPISEYFKLKEIESIKDHFSFVDTRITIENDSIWRALSASRTKKEGDGNTFHFGK